MRLLANLEYRFLRWAYPTDPNRLSGDAYQNRSKLEALLGPDVFDKTRNKVVIDFGCGYGAQTVELAKRGAKQVIGVDIRKEVLDKARETSAGIDNVVFLNPAQCQRGLADCIISLDSFEHFSDPSGALRLMYALLCPGGMLLTSFGPPWDHPLGGHAFSVFPWSHLLVAEHALCHWYSDMRNQAIARFEDVSGGLNRMTIAKFERIVAESPFRDIRVIPVPIRKFRRFHNRLTREFTTSVIRCVLTK